MYTRRYAQSVALLAAGIWLEGCPPNPSSDSGVDSGADLGVDLDSGLLDGDPDAHGDSAIDAPHDSRMDAGPDGTPVPCLSSDPVPPPDGLPCADPGLICDHNAMCQPLPYAIWSCTCGSDFVWHGCMGPFVSPPCADASGQ